MAPKKKVSPKKLPGGPPERRPLPRELQRPSLVIDASMDERVAACQNAKQSLANFMAVLDRLRDTKEEHMKQTRIRAVREERMKAQRAKELKANPSSKLPIEEKKAEEKKAEAKEEKKEKAKEVAKEPPRKKSSFVPAKIVFDLEPPPKKDPQASPTAGGKKESPKDKKAKAKAKGKALTAPKKEETAEEKAEREKKEKEEEEERKRKEEEEEQERVKRAEEAEKERKRKVEEARLRALSEKVMKERRDRMRKRSWTAIRHGQELHKAALGLRKANREMRGHVKGALEKLLRAYQDADTAQVEYESARMEQYIYEKEVEGCNAFPTPQHDQVVKGLIPEAQIERYMGSDLPDPSNYHEYHTVHLRAEAESRRECRKWIDEAEQDNFEQLDLAQKERQRLRDMKSEFGKVYQAADGVQKLMEAQSRVPKPMDTDL